MPDIKGFQCVFEDYIQPYAKGEAKPITGQVDTLGLLANRVYDSQCAGVTHAVNPKAPMDMFKTDNLHYGTPENSNAQTSLVQGDGDGKDY